MSSTNRVFVSPGVYTSEKDITFITKQIGVTTLGLVGETTKGPAFQPIFVSNYNEFKSFFGGLDATKIKSTGAMKYELGYIAKSYFTKSNQMYVTRVLGFSGYDAGKSWAIVTDSNKVVVLLRSRATYTNGSVPMFNISGNTDLVISTTGVTSNVLSEFTLSGFTNGNTGNTFTYNVSLDPTNKNYISRVLGVEANDGKGPIFVEEIYPNAIADGIKVGAFTGLSQTLVSADDFSNYKTEYSPAISPYVVSEVNGNVIKKLFRFVTISDGDSANSEIKISISNIKPNDREFDVQIRSFFDTDANPIFLEKYSRCTMDPTSDNFIGRKIGTLDGYYASKSNYVLIELDEDEVTSDSFPAGFTGVPSRVFTGAQVVDINYNTSYDQFAKLRKIYLGLSDTVGIDQDFLDYKGVDAVSGITSGFHMDIDASGATLDGYTFVYGDSNFQNDAQLSLSGNSYEKIYSRKFTFAPYGGFDGWDIYRADRTNKDTFVKGQTGSNAALVDGGVIRNKALSDGEVGTTADYYAYLEAIHTFRNPEETNVNVFVTPGIDVVDNSNLVEAAVAMVEEERCDSIYIVTSPDLDGGGQVITVEEAVDNLESTGIDSSYTATYWPWVQVNDTENNVLVYLPPTIDVCRNIALTDNIAFPWFVVAGIQRGDVQAIKARKKLTVEEREVLYAGRINPIATFATEGLKIWGNKTLQIRESALDRINVRRLLLQARKLISAVSIRLLFEQNDEIVRNQFKGLVNPILENIRSERGLTDFRVEVDNSPESIDRNELIGRIYIKPTRALEFIIVEFTIMNTGATFDVV
jgi:hypothetical protein